MSPPVQSRSLRSVIEVQSLQSISPMDGHVESATNIVSEMQIRPEYADMDPLHHNRSHGDQEHYHGDPITGHMASLSWHNSQPCHQEDSKLCHISTWMDNLFTPTRQTFVLFWSVDQKEKKICESDRFWWKMKVTDSFLRFDGFIILTTLTSSLHCYESKRKMKLQR